MASIREVSSIAEDLLCSVCLSIFQEPRMLGCGHNFCLNCLESVVPKGLHQGTCPECRCPFSLQDAMCNRVLANLAEKARLLKLEEGAQSDGAGSWYFCEEHEEPLKLFCSEDEAPVCVICRDLPQHQGHHFLPLKNAVKDCQSKLKASLESLEDGMKWAINNKSHQQEAIEELETLSQHLYGHIFIEFENLRQILDAREQSMMDTVKQLKEDNQAKMEGRLEYLKSYESSHAETISMIHAALEESNEFALLKGIKELMQRIQDRLEEGNEAEHEVCSPDQEAKETEEEDAEHETVGVIVPERKGNETKNDEGEPYEEAQDTEGQKAEDRDIVSVDPALVELEEWLDFETWKEMLESITIEEIYNQESNNWLPSPEEDIFQSEDGSTSEATAEETSSVEKDLICSVDVVTAEPGQVASAKPSPSSWSETALPIERVLHSQPPNFSTPNYFPIPAFQQMPLYNSVQRWVSPCGWRMNPRRGWGMMPGRGGPFRPSFWPRQGQGRAFPNTQVLQHTVHSWRSPKTETLKATGSSASGQGRGWFKKQNSQHSGSNISSQSSAGKAQPPKPRGAHTAGQGRSGQGRGSSGSGRGSAHPSGHGGSGQGRGSSQKGPTHHSRGQASSSKGPSNRQTSHHGGRGSSSAKGSQRK